MGRKIILASDLDATLVTDRLFIVQRNIDAIHEFSENGNLFVLATGRSPISSRKYYDMTGGCPRCVIYNGAGVYDYEEKRFLWKDTIDKSDFLPMIRDIRNRFPDLGFEFWHDDGIFQLRHGHDNSAREKVEAVRFIEADERDLPDKCFKMLLSGEKERVDEAVSYCTGYSERIRAVCSNPRYCELLSATANKGTALMKLKELTAPDAFVAAIGDYDNDIDMLKCADISAAPSNALEEVKKCADIVVCDCRVGAVAELIDHLKKFSTEGM